MDQRRVPCVCILASRMSGFQTRRPLSPTIGCLQCTRISIANEQTSTQLPVLVNTFRKKHNHFVRHTPNWTLQRWRFSRPRRKITALCAVAATVPVYVDFRRFSAHFRKLIIPDKTSAFTNCVYKTHARSVRTTLSFAKPFLIYLNEF